MEDEVSGREANKICGVCGDRALGYNFNAVSCESCKAFFRRNALKNKDFRCPFTENCDISVVTRRFCQKCRLDKCFSIGMRKEYIMSEEDKVLKRQKIEQNRAKKRPQQDPLETPKLKRENLEENNFEHEMTSVSSVTSETYVWESDRKYMDLDGHRQQAAESLSPVTTASVPSPSSPPESANIAGSKTIDMLKDPSPNRTLREIHKIDPYDHINSNFEPCQLSFSGTNQERTRYLVSSPSLDSYDSSSKYENSTNSPLRMEQTTVKSGNVDPALPRFTQTVSGVERVLTNSPHLDQHSTKIKTSLSDRHLNASESQSSRKQIICQKSKGFQPQVSNYLVSKFSKALSNPDIAVKLLQDQGFIAKIMMDTDTVSKLISDPQISKLLEENDVTSTNEIVEQLTDHSSPQSLNRTLANNGISDNMIRHMLEAEQKQVENPILTNLITNQTPPQCKSHASEPNTSGSWLKSTEDTTRDILQDVQRIPIAANSIESILCEAIKLEFSACSTLGGNTNSRELNDAERAKLNELIVANKALLTPLDDDITNLVGEDCRFKGNAGQSDPVLLDVINLTAIAIRRLIKMSKKINAFKNMCQEDQLALLKGGCTEMMILRAASNYDPDKDMWQIPHSQERMSKIKVDVLKEAKGNLYSEHSRFVKTFDPRWRDENIILILSAIALFTPDRPRVIHSDVIKLEQNSYYYLLRRYLESIYPGCEAKSTFLKLIQKISELHKLNDEVVGVYLNVNPSSVEPLLIEIFDLKH